MAENKAKEAAGEAQEPLKTAKRYKVTCGAFKARNEALRNAATARKAGVHVSLVIGKTGYVLLYVEDISKAAAEAAKKEIEAKKVKAEVSEM